MPNIPSKLRSASWSIAVVLICAACGASGTAGTTTVAPTTAPPTTIATTTTEAPTTTAGSVPGFPVTVETVAGAVTVPASPQAIVSLSPTSTEVLFAIGAGGQVIAVDDQSNYPADAPVTALTGFSSSAEAVAAFDPDLVFISFDPGDLVSGLEAVGIPTVVHPAAVSLEDAYRQIEQAGALTGNVDGASAIIEGIEAQVDELVAGLADRVEPLTYFHELDNTFYSLTSSTFVGELYGLLGLASIADPADTDGFGYPQLSEEYILEQDPDFIFLADTKCCGQNAGAVAARPGWDQLSAVQQGRVIELDDDIASRWGPRISEFLSQVASAVDSVPVG